jgi:predicted component of type VI protein secretion system
MCIGLLIGLAQVILKEAWVRVEAGFRPGRELIVTKPITTVGKAESCDLGLFGGRGVEKLHARIVMQGSEYYVGDNQTPGGTFVNDQRVQGFQRLRSGDRIRVGDCVLLFRERARR